MREGKTAKWASAFLMSLCDKRFTATQYALLSSLMAMSRVLAGVPTGFMAKKPGLAHVLRRDRPGGRPGDLAFDTVCAVAKGQSGVGGVRVGRYLSLFLSFVVILYKFV